MIKNFLIILLTILFFFASSIISQNRRIHKKREPITTKKMIPQNNAGTQRNSTLKKKEISKRNPRKESRKNFDKKVKDRSPKKNPDKNRKGKIYSERPGKLIKKYQPKKKKKKIEEIIYVENEIIFEEEIIYNEEPTPFIRYCRPIKMHEKDYYVSHEIYPDFNMKFVNGNIKYVYTIGDKHYYAAKIKVQPINDLYFKKFAVLIKYFNYEHKLLIFNEHEEMLYPDEQYEYSKVMDLKYSGYANLRIGYFNCSDKTFYPARYLGNKTELSIYVNEGGGNRIDFTTREIGIP